MIRSRTAGIAAAAALVVAACGKQDAQPNADASAAPPPPAEAPAPPTGISGAPGVARRGVDSASAAYQAQESAVDSLARQAGGTAP